MLKKAVYFDNSFADAYPQTVVADMVRKHIYSDNSSRKKRVLIYGFDGARADSLTYIVSEKEEFTRSKYSAFEQLKSRAACI